MGEGETTLPIILPKITKLHEKHLYLGCTLHSSERFSYCYLICGCRKGKGTFYYLNGDRLIAEWSRDFPNGEGIYQYKNGDR
jgi:hypothetical protein